MPETQIRVPTIDTNATSLSNNVPITAKAIPDLGGSKSDMPPPIVNHDIQTSLFPAPTEDLHNETLPPTAVLPPLTQDTISVKQSESLASIPKKRGRPPKTTELSKPQNATEQQAQLPVSRPSRERKPVKNYDASTGEWI